MLLQAGKAPPVRPHFPLHFSKQHGLLSLKPPAVQGLLHSGNASSVWDTQLANHRQNTNLNLKILSKYNKSITRALVVLGLLCACEYMYVYRLVCLHEHVGARVWGQVRCAWPQTFQCLCLQMCAHFCSGDSVAKSGVCVCVCLGTCVHDECSTVVHMCGCPYCVSMPTCPC